MTNLSENWQDQNGSTAASDVLATLEQAADGLLMPSENDYPFIPFRWPGPEPLTAATLLAYLRLPPDTPVEQRAFTTVFARLTAAYDWHNDDDRAQVARFTTLRDAFAAHLAHLAVYRVGVIRIDVFIVGTTPDGVIVGLQTIQIET